MNAVDVMLFHWINAGANSPAWLIDLVALYSKHMPSLVIASMLVCLAVGGSRLRKAMCCCLLAMLVAWCLTRLIRWGFPTERPYDMGLGDLWIAHGSRPRFPSLHATVAFAFATGISIWCSWGRWRWISAGLAWGAALFIAWSRIYVGVHLPFDIAAGLVVGALSAYLVRAVMPRQPEPDKSVAYSCLQLAPSASRK